MADLDHLDEAIAFAAGDAFEDSLALQDLQACLIAGLGLTIAVAAGGDPRAADRLCEQASILIVEQVASVTQLLRRDGRV